MAICSGVCVGGCASAKTNSSSSSLPIDERKLSSFDYSLMNLSGKDALGRSVNRMDGFRSDAKYVGLFYSLWAGQHKDIQKGIYNITSLLETQEGKNALQSTTDNDLSKVGQFHYWGEPLYGYYNSSDPFVLTRHIELLTLAGIDYLCVDATNYVVYYQSTQTLMDLLLKFQNQGWRVPKICFYTNSMSGNTVDLLYSRFYSTEKYEPIWFMPNGKPLIIGITENNAKASDQTKYSAYTNFISKEMQAFFDVRESEWPNGAHNDNSIPWMSWDYPQRIHSDTGAIAVPVAQHSHSKIFVSSEDPECSRGYDNIRGTVDENYENGHSFQDMWNTVFSNERKIKNVLCTSWNEWMAIKQVSGNASFWVDVYSQEYSRDMEMQKGGLNDDFYLQLMENVRKLKMTDGVPYSKKETRIDISQPGPSPLWDYVTAQYKDFEGDAVIRDFGGAVDGLAYKDESARNDISLVKVCHDSENVYFYIECVDPITAYNGADENYMNVFLTVDGKNPSFAGFDYLINRSLTAKTGSVEKSLGGYAWEKVGDASYQIKGKVMEIAIPKKTLGLAGDVSFSFKVSDHVSDYKDIMDYYVSGDSAPIGRLSYVY